MNLDLTVCQNYNCPEMGKCKRSMKYFGFLMQEGKLKAFKENQLFAKFDFSNQNEFNCQFQIK